MDREQIIRQATVIDRLRVEVRTAEQLYLKKRRELDTEQRRFDSLLGTSPKVPSYHLKRRPQEGRDGLGGGASIAGAIRLFFLAGNGQPYALKDVMESCGIRRENFEAARKALQRLFHEGFLLRLSDGVYQLAPHKKS